MLYGSESLAGLNERCLAWRERRAYSRRRTAVVALAFALAVSGSLGFLISIVVHHP